MTIPFLISVGLLVTMTLLSFGLWSALPPDTLLPIHFDWRASPDRFARPAVALFLLPAVTLIGILALLLAPWIKPNVMNSPGVYAGIWLLFLIGMCLGQGMILRHALMSL